MEKSHNQTEASLNNSEKSHNETNYYPSDREILAAKASEILAECIRVSALLPHGERVSLYFVNGNTIRVYSSESACNGEVVYLDWSDASKRLDEILVWVKSFAQEVAA